MNLDREPIEVDLDLAAIAWAILRKNPVIQAEFIVSLLEYTDSMEVVRAVRDAADSIVVAGDLSE
jgi:hypothetical protein